MARKAFGSATSDHVRLGAQAGRFVRDHQRDVKWHVDEGDCGKAINSLVQAAGWTGIQIAHATSRSPEKTARWRQRGRLGKLQRAVQRICGVRGVVRG